MTTAQTLAKQMRYNAAWCKLKRQIQEQLEHHKAGEMQSFAEAIHGESVCREILDKMKSLEKNFKFDEMNLIRSETDTILADGTPATIIVEERVVIQETTTIIKNIPVKDEEEGWSAGYNGIPQLNFKEEIKDEK